MNRPSPSNVAPFVLNALDYLDQGITVFDARLCLVTWNRHMVELLGFPKGLLHVGMPLEDLIRFNAERGEYGPGVAEEQVEQRMALARQCKAHCFERIRPDGTIVEVKGNPLAGGGFVTVYSDVTQRRRNERVLERSAQELEHLVRERTASLRKLNQELRDEIRAHRNTTEALRESSQWMRTITDSIPVLIAYLGDDMRCRFTNRRADEWFGGVDGDDEESNRALARRIRFVDDLRGHAVEAFSGHSVAVEVAFTDRESRSRMAAVNLVPHVRDDDDAVQGLFLLAQDVTEIKRTQAALLESGKLNAVGQLTGALAHDFGNMLAIVQGNLAFIAQLLGDTDADLAESMASCLRTVERGADLTRRLLAFARRQSLQPQSIDVRGLLDDFSALTRHPLGERIRLDVAVQQDTRALNADPSGLENALLNLVFNARDAMPSGGAIRIDADNYHAEAGAGVDVLPAGDYVRLRVQDDGVGIPREHLDLVMEPFFTTKHVGAGTGLGLSTVYGFVKQSHGDIRIDSEYGRGTRVDIILPAATTTRAATRP